MTWGKSTRDRIERGFERFGALLYRNRFKTILLVLLAVGAMASNVPKITVDTSTEGFLHENDPILRDYNAFRDQFGRDEMVLIALNPENVFDFGFLEKLKALHEELKYNVPHLDDITSIVNARNTRGEGDELIVEDLLENWPRDEAELEEVKKRALENPVYRNLLLSEDAKFTTIVIKTANYSGSGNELDIMEGFEDTSPGAKDEAPREYLTDAENGELVKAVKEIVEKYRAPDFPIYLAGSPVVTDDLKKAMMKDMRRFMLMAVVIISVVLFALFRRLSGVLLPLVTVVLTLVFTIGLMAFFGTSIKMPTQILPSFLLAVGVGASVHVLAIFYRKFNETGDKGKAIAYSLGHSGLAIVMTSLTTAAGLGSFATAEIAPVADLGRYAAAGVLVSLFLTIILIPALLAITPLRPKKVGAGDAEGSVADRMLDGIAIFATSHPKKIVIASTVIFVASLALAAGLRFSHNVLRWFPEDMAVKKATEKIDRELKGSITMEVVVDTGKENGLYSPELLKNMDKLEAYILEIKEDGLFVGKALSVADILKEIHKALNENRQEYYAIPENRDVISQEFLLFENSGSDDLEDFVDSQFSKARFTIKVPWLDAITYTPFMDRLKGDFRSALGDDVKITVTGMMAIFGRTLYASMVSAGKSYVIAAVAITFMMILLLGNFKLGLISMIPNLYPIILTMGVMGGMGLPLDMFTMLIGSIAIGLVVDDTVHFMHNFRRYYHDTRDVAESTRMTLHGTGRAMLVTSIVLSLGFFIFMFASMNNLFNFGLLTGFSIVVALLADFLLAPALMALAPHPEKEFEDR